VKRDFDLILYGATGYTGRLIAENLATSYRSDDAPSWAIAGRSTDAAEAATTADSSASLILIDQGPRARLCPNSHTATKKRQFVSFRTDGPVPTAQTCRRFLS
jgi:short subunit dehydrogenase-like uncharacterized protein